MKRFMKPLAAVGTAALLVFSSGASAVPFSITATQFVPGLGYGIDFDETPNGNLLDVRFSTSAFATQNFALSAVNQSFTFTFGTIDLEEPERGGGIDSTELDGLGISAKLTFTAPTGVTQTITTTGVAVPGSISDNAVDYSIDWTPVTVAFAGGGSFRISLTDMSFSGLGTQNQTATITLLSLADGLPSNDTNVPEPASIALLGIGIAGAAFARRRRTMP